MGSHDRAEVEAAVARYLEFREAIRAGEQTWSAFSDMFTDDAVFDDATWGRYEGKAAVRTFLEQSMAGLDDWEFPHLWSLIDGDRVVLGWANRLPGKRDDGSRFDVPGVSVLTYAGDGRFSSETDLYSESFLHEVLAESGWRPSGPMNIPPSPPPR